MAEAQLSATIDGKVYPIQGWRTVADSETLREVWSDGFVGGITEYTRRSRDRYREGADIDTTRYPEVRVRPRLGDGTFPAFVTTPLLATNLPVYGFLARSPNGTEYVYVLNGRRSFKIQVSDGTLAETKDFGVGAQCGRNALFEKSWYVPLGGTVDAQELTTITDPGGGVDTWNTMNVKALAFAHGSKDGIAQLARAHTINLVDVTANVTRVPGDWSADDFEVGDDSTAIIDLHFIDGEYMVVKQDGPWLMDLDGNSFPVEEFSGRTESTDDPNDGANSYSVGPYFFWLHRSGFWRFLGQRGRTVGFDADVREHPLSAEIGPTRWFSADGLGRWIYATNGLEVFHGYIREDGTIIWHGSLFSAASTNRRLFITESPTATEFFLWICDDDVVRRLRLEVDGSTRGISDSRGDASLTSRIKLPFVDFGLPTRRKQLRKLWVQALGTWTNVVGRFRVYRDWQTTSVLVPGSVTAAGLQEFVFTPGSSDLAYTVALRFEIVMNASFTPLTDDPRITQIGAEAVTPTVIETLIVATPAALKGRRMTVAAVMQRIRNLVNGAAVAITEPDQAGPRDAFTGYVVRLSEQAIGSGKSESSGYLLRVRIARYDYGS